MTDSEGNKMYCPIKPKKYKLESCCIICSKDSYSADNAGDLTLIFLNYLFPPADREEVTEELLRLFTFCKNCASILNELIEFHNSFEHIQNNIKNTVKNIKCSILKNGDDGIIIDTNVRKFRKIATRDYRPKLILENVAAVFSKVGPFENNPEIQVANNTNAHYGQLKKRGSVIDKKQTKVGWPTSADILKSLNSKTPATIDETADLETRSDATSLSPTLTCFSTDCDTVDCNQESAVQPNPKYNQIANDQEFSGQQSRIIRSAEVIIPMESDFSFAEEEGTVQFQPWDPINQEEQDKDKYLQERNVIIDDSQNSDGHNGSHNIIAESQSVSTKKCPTFKASCERKSLDPADKTIKSISWTPPDSLSRDNNITNVEKRKGSLQKATENHSTHLWIPQSPGTPPLSQVNDTQVVRSQKLTSHQNNVTTHSTNLWVEEGFSHVNSGNITASVSADGTVTDISLTKKYGSPPFTFAQMIFIAITNSANRRATPDAIMEFIVKIFPFYKYYDLKRIACQLLTECSAFEEAYPEENNIPRFYVSHLRNSNVVYVVKRYAVSDFIVQIKIQIRTCNAPPSDYMINPDHYLKRALANEHVTEVPLTTAPPTPMLNYSNATPEHVSNVKILKSNILPREKENGISSPQEMTESALVENKESTTSKCKIIYDEDVKIEVKEEWRANEDIQEPNSVAITNFADLLAPQEPKSAQNAKRNTRKQKLFFRKSQDPDHTNERQ